ncbi:MAG: hypothetical protein ACFCUV_21030 [Rivularia sp. (in: cyanobacteria)]
MRFGEFYWLEWWKHGLRREIFQVFGHYLRTHRSPKLYLRQGRAYWRKITKQKVEFPTWFNADFVKQQDLQQRYQKMGAESIDYISRYGMANSPFWSNLFEQFDPGQPLAHTYRWGRRGSVSVVPMPLYLVAPAFLSLRSTPGTNPGIRVDAESSPDSRASPPAVATRHVAW